MNPRAKPLSRRGLFGLWKPRPAAPPRDEYRNRAFFVRDEDDGDDPDAGTVAAATVVTAPAPAPLRPDKPS